MLATCGGAGSALYTARVSSRSSGDGNSGQEGYTVSTLSGLCYHQAHRQRGDVVLGFIGCKCRDNETHIRPEEVGFDTCVRADMLGRKILPFDKRASWKTASGSETGHAGQPAGNRTPECSRLLFPLESPSECLAAPIYSFY